ncbi:hypothetical protein [Streptomyces sp. PTY087I2]|uniref:hypothetical protein n=1 Tax=Streptomyces sp. PTY087I2 TaxID=1819298 RepID=UPI00080B28E9|nr:hypothetical protein [Streptomyces sp. PTY087I2]OCC12034.1 hypothetical protein A3Q37_02225 [Streptomyces sp. PTY087I2]
MTTGETALQPGEFEHYLDEIFATSKRRIAYLGKHGTISGAPQIVALPPHIKAVQFNSGNVPMPIQDCFNSDYAYPNEQQASTNNTNVDQALDRYNTHAITDDDFDAFIDSQDDQNKAAFNASQDRTNQTLKNLGHEHPEWQEQIVNLFQESSNFLLGSLVWGGVYSAMESMRTIKRVVPVIPEASGNIAAYFKNQL